MDPYHLQKRNVAILVVSQTLFMVAAITVMTLSGVVGQQLSPDPGLATLPIAVMMLGTVVSTLPASLYMKRVGRRRGFMTGASLGGVAGGLLSFTAIGLGSFWLFCLGSALLGLYQGFAMYYRFAAVDVASPSFRSRAISFVLAGGVAAAFLGPWNASLATGLVAGVPSGGPYLVIAILALLAMGLLSQLRVPPGGEPRPGETTRPMPAIARQPAFQVAVIAGAIGYAIMILVMTATPLAMRARGFEMGQIAFIMQWHVLGMYVPSFITGSLIARFGVGRILLAGSVLLAGTVGVAVLGNTLVHFWLALVLLGIGWNFLFVGGSTLLSTTHSEGERGKVQGINDLAIFSLVAVGSLMSGSLLHHLGWETLNLIMLAPITLVLLAIIWLRMNSAPRPATTGAGIRDA
ncbi:Predicted arabinose efflux permease, MFS family [Marinobacter daqiaonensis]|uniref:Predicted arabinose efflux permease, MFS family n=1 Tax=Marinobacter daqiaonensis TaxID=650891 RepID=A0A1I6IHV7_9GAMM|nr:MFS transporter [Marinobacter daqiaonensis]SFR66335.1 Predicted arabinose efflux permease, MFS family [Marinobacter daqiaonensis]